MSAYFRPFIAAGLLTVLLVTGCDDGGLFAPEPADEVRGDEIRDEAITSRLFTGRDSFGVAFKARVSGTWEDAISCKTLTGTGNATHLGRVEVEQTICVEESEITAGEFVIAGSTGGAVKGTYLRGTLTPEGEGFRIAAKDTITGGVVRATPLESEAGRATMTGILHGNGRFTYRLDGWLLHHVREEGE